MKSPLHHFRCLFILAAMAGLSWPLHAKASDPPPADSDVPEGPREPAPSIQAPIELFVGDDRVQHEFFLFAALGPQSVVSVFSVGRFALGWQDRVEDRSFLSAQAIFNASKWLGVAVGGTAVGDEVSPLAGLSLYFATPDHSAYINLFPTILYSPRGDVSVTRFTAELFALASWRPHIAGDWGLFTQLTATVGVPLTFNDHLYSFTQLRIGPSFRERLQFGFAIDQDFIGSGPGFGYSDNIGVFLRWEL